MMIPSISILEIPAPDGGIIYQAFSQVEGELVHHEQHVEESLAVGIPAGLIAREMRRHVAHSLLEKMMVEIIDRA